ncbi:MAG: terminase small subunit [Anaerotignum sp.]|nr:terminase small subunit [Anaerotignum sp.]
MPKGKGGRPPKYKCKEEIEGLIETYFEECEGIPWLDEEGKPLQADKGFIIYKKRPKPPTVTGLALALGFSTRLSLLNYQAKPEFMNTITRAKTFIEEYAERRLFDREGVQGAKFSLINNFKGWSDKPKDDSDKELFEKLDDILEGINHAAKQ